MRKRSFNASKAATASFASASARTRQDNGRDSGQTADPLYAASIMLLVRRIARAS